MNRSIGTLQAIRSMRASPDDPAKSPEAKAKRAASNTEQERARRAWEREHGRDFDLARYEQEVVPVIRRMTVLQLASATGLSTYYCWQIRAGRRRLHPRHWAVIL